MTNKKKTLYEILEVLPNATSEEIQASHQSLSQKLQSKRTSLNSEDIEFKLKVINVAFQTLSVQMSRDAYDAQLSTLNSPANLALTHHVVVRTPGADAMSLKADAMSLKADAMSLKADAVLLMADAMSLKVKTAPQRNIDGGADSEQSAAKIFFSILANLAPPFKKLLMIIGSMAAVGMVFQVVFLLITNRQTEHGTSAVSTAEEKLMIQEYYQEHGVRPGSKIEADLLDVENRRKENEQRQAAFDKQREEERYRQFIEESRRMGKQVSEELRREEEKAREAAELEQQRLAQEKRDEEEKERIRIELERQKLGLERQKLGLE